MFDYSCEGVRLTAHRKPTKAEINRGYGATHYKDIPVSLFERFIVGGKTEFKTKEGAFLYANAIQKRQGVFVSVERQLKNWIVCPIDGLRYYR